jgi:hypothetical protein
VGVSQKSISKRPCRFLAINTHKMDPRTSQGLQERAWDAPSKGLLWGRRGKWHGRWSFSTPLSRPSRFAFSLSPSLALHVSISRSPCIYLSLSLSLSPSLSPSLSLPRSLVRDLSLARSLSPSRTLSRNEQTRLRSPTPEHLANSDPKHLKPSAHQNFSACRLV